MKDKRILLALFLLLASTAYPAMIEGSAEEIDIDLNTNTMTSKEGVVLQQSNMRTKVHTLQRDAVKGMTYYRDGVLAQIDSPTGLMKIESKEGDANSQTKEANFYTNFGYLNVSAVTGAEAPNDRIYFGSDHIQYRDEKVYLHRAWTTTDFKIINHSKNPKEVDYHILSKEMVIEPDKQLTIYDSNLYLGEKKTLPFDIPWYRLNIRSGSKVPLFPTWNEKNYYGWNISWGILYGNKKTGFRGGIAPKFADRMGWMLGRWETWYDTKTFGELQVNVSDLMLKSKVAQEKDKITAIEFEEKHKRYHIETKHDYDGKYGSFHFLGENASISMLSSLNDLITKYEANGEFNNKNGIQGTGVSLARPHFDKNIGFYHLQSDLKGMGKNQDISLQGDFNLTTNKNLYILSIYDNVEDNVFGTKYDNALYTNLALYQDNAHYKIGGYYHYLHDITPGYTRKYSRSRGEDYGFIAFDKQQEIGLQYDETKGDQLRNLQIWEIESNANLLTRRNPLGLPIDYTPAMVSEFEKKTTKDWKVSLGKYEMVNYEVRPTFTTKFAEKKLDSLVNESIVVRDNSNATPSVYTSKAGYERFREYNRFQNEIYAKTNEKKANVNIYQEKNLNANVFVGNQSEDILARDGQIATTEKAVPIQSRSHFYGMDFEKKFGNFVLRGDLRYDDYQKSDGSSWRWGAGINHQAVFYEKEDTKVSNHLDIYAQKYHYQGRKEEDKAQNLYTKEDRYQVKDTLFWDTKAVHTEYQGEYKLEKNPYTSSEKKAEITKQKMDFQFAEDKKVGFFYNMDARYTNRMITKEAARKDLAFENYGFHFQYQGHQFNYRRQNVDFQPTVKSQEKLQADRYRYSYAWDDKTLSFYYHTGKDKISLRDFHDPQILDIDNKVYGLSFHKKGDIQHTTYINYEDSHHKEGSSKVNLNGRYENIGHTDSVNFSYQYRDTRLSDAEYIKYASLETGKEKEKISIQEIEKIKSILSHKEVEENPFHLTGIREDAFLFGDHRVNFRVFGTLKRNKARYERTNNLADSLEKIKGSVFYSYNRYGLGYTFEQNAGWISNGSGYDWKKKNREHQVSFYGKVGRPSDSWKIKTYAKFYENLLDRVNADRKKKSLDGLGIEIGKEHGFYEWSVVYERAYSLSARDYEWRVGLQFILLTFPDNAIFGAGPKKTKKHTSIKTEFMDKINIERIVDDELHTKEIMKK